VPRGDLLRLRSSSLWAPNLYVTWRTERIPRLLKYWHENTEGFSDGLLRNGSHRDFGERLILAKEQVHEKATCEREAKRAVSAASLMNSRHQR
jgi:tRNA isopentenyl-2-thiomethyl-A-37 hydroxylase MiaE